MKNKFATLIYLTMKSKQLLKYLFRCEPEFSIFLGTVKQKGSVVAFINAERVWHQESLSKKITSILSLNWRPSDYLIQRAAQETLNHSIFGNESDYNEGLIKINAWHNSREWNLEELSEIDLQKADGLNALTVMVRNKHRRVTSPFLHLGLFEKMPEVCTLTHAMVVKIPVTSMLHFIDIHSAFAFNEIRLSKIENAEDIISYIYDLQGIQQKTALALNEFLYLIDYTEKNKGDALLIQAELSAISEAESIVSYLKATIEKVVVIIGLIFNLKGLETKKTHKAKLDALAKAFTEVVKDLPYYKLIADTISTESIQELNNYRNGLLHKKGLGTFQPHSYVGQDAKDLPLNKIISFLMDQHIKNSAVIVCTYALLTDELCKLSPPGVGIEELPY